MFILFFCIFAANLNVFTKIIWLYQKYFLILHIIIALCNMDNKGYKVCQYQRQGKSW